MGGRGEREPTNSHRSSGFAGTESKRQETADRSGCSGAAWEGHLPQMSGNYFCEPHGAACGPRTGFVFVLYNVGCYVYITLIWEEVLFPVLG